MTSLTSLFAELDSSIDHLEGSHYASWQDTVDPFEEINDRMNIAWAVVDHLQVRYQIGRGRQGLRQSACVCTDRRSSKILRRMQAPCCFLQGVKNSDALRAVVDQLQPEQVRISQRLSQSSPLYSKFEAIRNSTGNWSESETRYVCQAQQESVLSSIPSEYWSKSDLQL